MELYFKGNDVTLENFDIERDIVRAFYLDNLSTEEEIRYIVEGYFSGLDDCYYYSSDRAELEERVVEMTKEFLKNNVVKYDAKQLWLKLLDFGSSRLYAPENSSKRRIMLNWLCGGDNNDD